MAAQRTVVVIGGGLAGLMSAMKLAEAGHKVKIFSLVPVKRSHSVCAQGGINGAVNLRGEGDSPFLHFEDTVTGGDFLNHQPPVLRMAERAPAIIYLLDRMGVPFNRTAEGLLSFRRFGGTLKHRTAYAGATTGQQLLYALDEQVRRWETMNRVEKYEGYEFLGIVKDEEGRCRGITAQNLKTMEIEAHAADAVVVASGGNGVIFGKSTNSIINTGSAVSILYQQGAKYGNPEMVQIHPTAIPGEDKCRLISESVRGEGGRIWTPRDPMDARPPVDIPEADRWYVCEEMDAKYGNLLSRDIVSFIIYCVCRQNKGIRGKEAGLSRHHPAPHEQGRPLLARDHQRQARGRAGDLREVHARGSDPDADADLPRRPLHHGRPVGGLRAQRRQHLGRGLPPQPLDEHPRPLRRRRVRVPVPRCEPPRGERAPRLPRRGRDLGPGRSGLPRRGGGRHRLALDRRARIGAAGEGVRLQVPRVEPRKGEPVPAPRRARGHHVEQLRHLARAERSGERRRTPERSRSPRPELQPHRRERLGESGGAVHTARS